MGLQKVATFTNPGSGTGFGNAWSPSGDRLAVAGYDNSVLAWDIASRELVLQAQHPGTVSCVSWSPDGRTLTSGTSAGAVHLLDSASGRELRRASGHTDEVRSVAFSPDGRYIASGANDGSVRVWGAAELAPVASIPAHNGLVRSVAWSPEGGMIASGGHDNVLRVWNSETWESSGGLGDHTGFISAVLFSPDGAYVASGGADATIRIWDLAAQKYHRVLDQFDGWWIWDFAFSPDSRQIAALNNDPAIYLYDIDTGELLTTERAPFGTTAISWSPDGRHIAASGFETTIWNATGT